MKPLLNEDDFFDLGEYLNSPDACNFQEDGSWTCYLDLRFTKKWLQEHNFDVEEMIKRINILGAYCDCEVLYNIVGPLAEGDNLQDMFEAGLENQ